jgi:putative endopeptidase
LIHALRAAGLLAAAVLALGPGGASAQRGFSLANVDPACKPCRDFSRYAMGGWQARNPIPATAGRWSVLDERRHATRVALRALLVAASHAGAPLGSAARKAGDYYASCMDLPRRDAAGIAPIAGYLRAIEGIHDLAGVRRASAALQNVGAAAFFSTGAEPDPSGEGRTLAFIAQGGLGLPDRDLYVARDARSARVREAYLAHVARDFRLLGDDPAESAAQARAVLGVETQLARAARPRAETRERAANVHRVTLAGAQALIASWDLAAFFAERMAPAVAYVDLREPEYLRGLDAVLRAAPISSLRAYLRYRLVERAAPALSAAFADEAAGFEASLSGRRAALPLWERCVRAADVDLGDALGRLYVEHSFNGRTREAARALVGAIRAEVRRRLASAAWLAPRARAGAVARLESVSAGIGYPGVWRSYEGLRIDRGPFAGNYLRAALYRARHTFAAPRGAARSRFWSLTAASVDASYSRAYGAVTLPAALLAPPLFSPRYDAGVGYGSLGVIVAHELTHAFEGEIARGGAASCLRAQLAAMHENGRLVAGEALADLGGVEIAYAALERALAGKPRAPIDGWTPEQRFFLAFAQAHASFERPERRWLLSILDPHPSGRDRILVTLANVPEFARAFGCRAGDAMVRPRAQRCTVW